MFYVKRNYCSTVHMYRKKNFGDELTFHHMDIKEFEKLMGGKYDPTSRAIKH
jgi:hypothetical protein